MCQGLTYYGHCAEHFMFKADFTEEEKDLGYLTYPKLRGLRQMQDQANCRRYAITLRLHCRKEKGLRGCWR